MITLIEFRIVGGKVDDFSNFLESFDNLLGNLRTAVVSWSSCFVWTLILQVFYSIPICIWTAIKCWKSRGIGTVIFLVLNAVTVCIWTSVQRSYSCDFRTIVFSILN